MQYRESPQNKLCVPIKKQDIAAIQKLVKQYNEFIKTATFHPDDYNPLLDALTSHKLQALDALLAANITIRKEDIILIHKSYKLDTQEKCQQFGKVLTHYFYPGRPSVAKTYTTITLAFYELVALTFEAKDLGETLKIKQAQGYSKFNDHSESAQLSREGEALVYRKYQTLKQHYDRKLGKIIDWQGVIDTIKIRLVESLNDLEKEQGHAAYNNVYSRQRFPQKGMNEKQIRIALCHTALRALLDGNLRSPWSHSISVDRYLVHVCLPQMLAYYYLAVIEEDPTLLIQVDDKSCQKERNTDAWYTFLRCIESIQRKQVDKSYDVESCAKGTYSRIAIGAAPNNKLAAFIEHNKLPLLDLSGLNDKAINFVVTQLREHITTTAEALEIFEYYTKLGRLSYLDNKDKPTAELTSSVSKILMRLSNKLADLNNPLHAKIACGANDILQNCLGDTQYQLLNKSPNKKQQKAFRSLQLEMYNHLLSAIRAETKKFTKQLNPKREKNYFEHDKTYALLIPRIQTNALRKGMFLLFNNTEQLYAFILKFYDSKEVDSAKIVVDLCNNKHRQDVLHQLINHTKIQNKPLFIKLISTHVDLSGMDFSNEDLTGADFSQANLQDVNLSNAILKATQLNAQANLPHVITNENTCFEQAKIGAQQIKQLIKSVNKTKVTLNLQNTDLANNDLSNVDLNQTKLDGTNLEGVTLTGAKFRCEQIMSAAKLKDIRVDLTTLNNNHFTQDEVTTLTNRLAAERKQWITRQKNAPEQYNDDKFNTILNYLSQLLTKHKSDNKNYHEVLQHGRQTLIQIVKLDTDSHIDADSVNVDFMFQVFKRDNSNIKEDIQALQKHFVNNSKIWIDNILEKEDSINEKYDDLLHYLRTIQETEKHQLKINDDATSYSNQSKAYQTILRYGKDQLNALTKDPSFSFKEIDQAKNIQSLFSTNDPALTIDDCKNTIYHYIACYIDKSEYNVTEMMYNFSYHKNRKTLFLPFITMVKQQKPDLLKKILQLTLKPYQNNLNLDNIDLSGMDLSGCKLDCVRLIDADLRSTNLSNTTIGDNVYLRGIQIDSKTTFENAQFDGRFPIFTLEQRAKHHGITVNLHACDLSNIPNLANINLTHFDLKEADLERVSLHDSTFTFQQLINIIKPTKNILVDRKTLSNNNFSVSEINMLKKKVVLTNIKWITAIKENKSSPPSSKLNCLLDHLNSLIKVQQHILKMTNDTSWWEEDYSESTDAYAQVVSHGRKVLIGLIKKHNEILNTDVIDTTKINTVFSKNISDMPTDIQNLQKTIFNNARQWIITTMTSDNANLNDKKYVHDKFKKLSQFLNSIKQDPDHPLKLSCNPLWHFQKTPDYYHRLLKIIQKKLHQLATNQHFVYGLNDDPAFQESLLHDSMLTVQEQSALKTRVIKYFLQHLQKIRDHSKNTTSQKLKELLEFLEKLNTICHLRTSHNTLWDYDNTDSVALAINYARKLMTELLSHLEKGELGCIKHHIPNCAYRINQQFIETNYSFGTRATFFATPLFPTLSQLDNCGQVQNAINKMFSNGDVTVTIPPYKFQYKTNYKDCLPQSQQLKRQ